MLARIGLIDYEIDPAACGNPEYAAPLFALDSAPFGGARLDRVWIGVGEDHAAEAGLRELGFTPAGEFRAASDRVGRRIGHPVCDLIVFQGKDGVARLDVSGALRTSTLKLAAPEVVCS